MIAPFAAPTNAPKSAAIPLRSWVLLVFVAAAAVLFVVDRQVLSLLKTTLRDQIGLTDVQYGWLVAAFMVPYTAMYLFTGGWIDRWGTRVMSLFFIGAMSVATIFTGLSRNFGELLACRILLGIAEAGIIPASILFVVQWFPKERRATALAIKSPIALVGTVLTPPLVAWITLSLSWRAAFLVPGIIGLVVAAAWWMLDRNPPDYGEPRVAKKRVSLLSLLRLRTLWPLLAARVVSDPFWFFLLYWHAGFLQEHLGLTLTQIGQWAWIPPLCSSLGILSAGVASDRLVARSFTGPRARSFPLIAAAGLGPLAIALPFASTPAVAIALLASLYFMCGAWTSLSNLFITELVPPSATATAVGLLSAVGGATSALFNLVAGPAIARAGYAPLLFVGAGLYPIAGYILWRAYAGKRSPAARAAA